MNSFGRIEASKILEFELEWLNYLNLSKEAGSMSSLDPWNSLITSISQTFFQWYYTIIPDHIGNLFYLKVLDLNSPIFKANDMAWILAGIQFMADLSPTHLNLITHSNIKHLDLSWNSVDGRFPSVLTNMSSLRVLYLSKNIHSSSFPLMPNLVRLELFGNEFELIEHVGIWRQCHLKELSVACHYFEYALNLQL